MIEVAKVEKKNLAFFLVSASGQSVPCFSLTLFVVPVVNNQDIVHKWTPWIRAQQILHKKTGSNSGKGEKLCQTDRNTR